MKITTDWKLDIKSREVEDKVKKANQLAMRDTVVDIVNDAVKNAKAVGFWLTGNNARSIMYEVGPGGEIAKNEGEGAVFSTSGYGGFGETGTRFMAARPYMKPALDKNFTKEKFAEKVKGHLGA